MIRRRIVIEWDDEGTDTDEECLKAFVSEAFSIKDITEPNLGFNTVVRVEDAKDDLETAAAYDAERNIFSTCNYQKV